MTALTWPPAMPRLVAAKSPLRRPWLRPPEMSGSVLTNEKRVLKVLINGRLVLRVLTNERPVSTVLTNEKPVL